MDLITVGTVAFDRIETPFGKADKVVGGAATYISLAASFFLDEMGLVSVVGDDFPEPMMADLRKRGVRSGRSWKYSRARRASSGPGATTTT